MTKSQKEKIEQLQKLSFFIILGKHASRSYSHNLAILKSSTLEERRQKIAINFAKKILKNSEHRKMFRISEGNTCLLYTSPSPRD